MQTVWATDVTIQDPELWVKSDLSPYVGQTVTFTNVWYLCSNYNGNYYISPRRLFSATNQTIPGSPEYYQMLSANQEYVYLNGVTGYHRTGEILAQLTVKVNSTSQFTLQSCKYLYNTRADILRGPDTLDLHRNGTPDLLVCGMNLEYYLVESFGTGYGPDSEAEHRTQRKKISKALALIGADIYGLVEVQQGQGAVKEIADDLSRLTGRHYTYINDGGSSSGSYTKSCYVYCSDAVTPIGGYKYTNTGVSRRKYMQVFRHIATGEEFIYSINHFKSKSGAGSATGADADMGDGQGAYNYTRQQEAQAVLNLYHNNLANFGDEDILIMGDLNAYGMEDPIRVLKDGGMTDLHRYFHADSSYSYTYHSEAGYLDHALCNATLLPQVTGVTVLHLNSDETWHYEYPQGDTTIFRCSDHDPVIVGLRLGSQTSALHTNTMDVLFHHDNLSIMNAMGGHVRIYDIEGRLILDHEIPSATYDIPTAAFRAGIYTIHIYYSGEMHAQKMLIP